MSDRIDCAVQSHPACFEAEAAEPEKPCASGASSPAPFDEPSRFECIDECLSSLGVAQLVAGVTSGLACLVSTPACAVLIGGSAGAMLGWCAAQCDEPAPDGVE